MLVWEMRQQKIYTTVETVAGLESLDVWLQSMASYRYAANTQALSDSACILADEFNILSLVVTVCTTRFNIR
jgi:hypothetical protein